ncbi:hypothetical protein B0H63DRAFT_450994 [Podospora didyma]|uniref:Uncharacterized protein n=1 Tax=Podospora didyma TaxID=330526 RepID=A0AAE0NHP3_9PEZI|nr:hypothetical protein B0H63DRAFT_450994 [Podospora didyma]
MIAKAPMVPPMIAPVLLLLLGVVGVGDGEVVLTVEIVLLAVAGTLAGTELDVEAEVCGACDVVDDGGLDVWVVSQAGPATSRRTVAVVKAVSGQSAVGDGRNSVRTEPPEAVQCINSAVPARRCHPGPRRISIVIAARRKLGVGGALIDNKRWGLGKYDFWWVYDTLHALEAQDYPLNLFGILETWSSDDFFSEP